MYFLGNPSKGLCVSVSAGGSINESEGGLYRSAGPFKLPTTTPKQCNYVSLIAVTMPERPTMRMNARASSLNDFVFLNCAFSH